MDTENIIALSSLSSNILKEIESLPSEFKDKSEEVRLLQKDLNELNAKYTKKENQIDKKSKDIIKNENNLISNLEEISRIKSEQKIIMDSLNEESFKNFTHNFYKIPNNFQEIILIFLQYQGKYKDELNFLMVKQENFNAVLRDSYSYFKSVEEFDTEKYESYRDKIKTLENGDNFKFNKNIKSDKKKNNKNKLMHPFDIIIEFIDNTFKIIDNSKYSKEMTQNIKIESANKEKMFIESKILQNEINEKQEKLKNIHLYIKHINNILIKYKNFFSVSSNAKISNNPNGKIGTIKENENKKAHNALNSDLHIKDKLILNSKISYEEKLNHKNDKNILNPISTNMEKYKNNNPNKILIKANINKDEKFKNNYELAKNQSNNILHSVNNSKKNHNSSIPSTKNSTQDLLNYPNNIKIISIVTSSIPENSNISNNSFNHMNNYDNNNNSKMNSLSIDYNHRNPNNKIKLGLISMYQSTTSKKYKNKITKTNSFEQADSGKISICNQGLRNEPNISISEIQDIKVDDRNPLKSNKQLYYSYQFNDDVNNDNKNYKEEEEKKTIVDNFNIVKYKGNENKNINIRKIPNLSPGIYNNSRKILKMKEKKKK